MVHSPPCPPSSPPPPSLPTSHFPLIHFCLARAFRIYLSLSPTLKLVSSHLAHSLRLFSTSSALLIFASLLLRLPRLCVSCHPRTARPLLPRTRGAARLHPLPVFFTTCSIPLSSLPSLAPPRSRPESSKELLRDTTLINRDRDRELRAAVAPDMNAEGGSEGGRQ